MTLSTSGGCEHCLKTDATGNGNSYAQEKVMIAVEHFWNFIDGKQFFLYTLYFSLETQYTIYNVLYFRCKMLGFFFYFEPCVW